ncbi:MAG: thymidylate kinase [Patescibacteria group bacterium]
MQSANTTGKLIVLEGTDGSGKRTQAELLVARLKSAGHGTETKSFPQYGKKSAGMIEEYLNGVYGEADTVNPYAASLFFALDRFDAAMDIRRWLADGKIVVLDRYTDSNVGHQGGKIADKGERRKFVEWLYREEYKLMGIPRPDLVLILHVRALLGQELVGRKEKREYLSGERSHDGHEKNLAHLEAAERAYLWLAEEQPHDHRVIECIENNALLAREEIHKRIWEAIEKKFPQMAVTSRNA